MKFQDIIDGRGEFRHIDLGERIYVHKEIAPHIVCQDNTTLSVQASETHYCTPRTDKGPYISVEVGYPTVTPPETWAEYADGDYPSDVYGYVPVEMVKQFIEAHGGEA